MNDFTKEELKRLLLRSFSWVAYPENQNKEELELIKKIEYMIENYCEHEKVVPNYGPNTQCDKCGEIW